MDAKTLEALKASIEKWKRNAVAKWPFEATVTGSSCPLCHLFCRGEPDDCTGCPVKERTGEDQCDNSPWRAAYKAHLAWIDGVVSKDDFHKRARAEVAFLESLLPEGERP